MPERRNNNVQIIPAPEAIRIRPLMYIDATDLQGPHVLLRLTVKSMLFHYASLEQPLDKVVIRFEDDGSATLVFQGPAPSAAFFEQSMQILERELRPELQPQNPRTSLYIVNALCEHLYMSIRGSDGSFRSLLFKQGVIAHDEELSTRTEEDGDMWFRLWPDLTILEAGVFDTQLTLEVMRSFRDSAPNTSITVIDARSRAI